MKLYYSKGACSLAVRIVINEIGLEASYESVDLKAKKTESGEDYLAINPKGGVPALVLDGGELLTENAVIQQYLADSSDATSLLPSIDNFKRYRVLEWLNYITTELHKGFSNLFNPKIPQDLKQNIFIPMLKSKILLIDNQLQKTKYITGDQFALPDAYMVVILNWVNNFKIGMDDWKNIPEYYEKLKSRPSVAKSFEQEGLPLSNTALSS